MGVSTDASPPQILSAHFNQLIVSRESLPNAELSENHIEHILDMDGTDDPAQAIRRQPQFLGAQFLARATVICGAKQMAIGLAEQFDMAQARWQNIADITGSLRRAPADFSKQRLHACPLYG
jgi:hypothetical protein